MLRVVLSYGLVGARSVYSTDLTMIMQGFRDAIQDPHRSSLVFEVYYFILSCSISAVDFSSGVWAIASAAHKGQKQNKNFNVITSLFCSHCSRMQSVSEVETRKPDVCLTTSG